MGPEAVASRRWRGPGRRPASWLRPLIAAAAVVLLATPAALATENEDDVDPADDVFINGPEDLEPGVCTPDEVAIEQVITCRFELVGNVSEVFEFTALHGALVEFDNFVGSRCVIEGRELVCPDIPVPFDEGAFEITVFPVGFDTPLATASIDRTTDGVLGLSILSRRVPTVLSGVESTIETFRSFALDDDVEAELLLRRDGDDTIVARVPALAPGATTGEAVLTIPEPGRWTLTGCVAEPDGSCRLEGIRRPIHAIDPTPIPLIPDHNGPAADRINLLFAGSGFQSSDDLVEAATSLLALDGQPIPADATGDGDIFALDWGPFAVEPLLDQADRFNFWYLVDDLPGGPITINPAAEFPSQLDVGDFGLGSRVSIINLSRNGQADGFRANAELASFADDQDVPELADVGFGSVYLPDDGLTGSSAATTLTHELGHALFGLRDEYEEPGVTQSLIGLPNCVATIEEAEALWVDQIGDLDPMFDRWRAAMIEFDLWFEDDDVADDFTVGLVAGGCYGPLDSNGVVRPTGRGLMNGQEPVFGSVNRARVEAVLDLFPEPPPPPPPTTTSTAPPPTTSGEQDPSPTTEAELASSQTDDDGSSISVLALAIGAGAGLAAVGVGAAYRRRG